jgi:4a-hydroxytetrahydrobiopterin dehydratase
MKLELLTKDFDYLGAIPQWNVASTGDHIRREFIFKDFKEAFAFMTLCAQYADEIDHHPDWSNSWNKVSVQLSTHSVGGLTNLDIQLAQAMDNFALKIHSQI